MFLSGLLRIQGILFLLMRFWALAGVQQWIPAEQLYERTAHTPKRLQRQAQSWQTLVLISMFRHTILPLQLRVPGILAYSNVCKVRALFVLPVY